MANSKFEYVKKFEFSNTLLPNTFMVVRIDGRGFTNFTTQHNFEKPNDIRGLQLMNKCAKEVMKQFTEIIISYGDSDEYSFIFKKSAKVFNRREDKILSTVLSLFSTSYVFYWDRYFQPEKYFSEQGLDSEEIQRKLQKISERNDTSNLKPQKLLKVPSFDARIVLYPSLEDMQNYVSWRQVDCHINNQYNTCFWTLVQKGGLTTEQAQKRLKGTLTKDKNEIMFTEFGINYNNIDEIFKRGSIWLRMISKKELKQKESQENKKKYMEKQTKQKGIREDLSKTVQQEEEKKESTINNIDRQMNQLDIQDKDSLVTEDIDIKKKVKELILVHDDLVEKPAFYEKYELYSKLK
eukprot:403350856